MENTKKVNGDPQPEHGKDANGHNGQENQGNNGNHKGWEKQQTRSHGLPCREF